MKVDLEQKLKEIWQESLDQNALAVHVVAHLLLANYQNGTHGDFARWCCRYMNDLQMEAAVNGTEDAYSQDFCVDGGQKEWIC